MTTQVPGGLLPVLAIFLLNGSLALHVENINATWEPSSETHSRTKTAFVTTTASGFNQTGSDLVRQEMKSRENSGTLKPSPVQGQTDEAKTGREEVVRQATASSSNVKVDFSRTSPLTRSLETNGVSGGTPSDVHAKEGLGETLNTGRRIEPLTTETSKTSKDRSTDHTPLVSTSFGVSVTDYITENAEIDGAPEEERSINRGLITETEGDHNGGRSSILETLVTRAAKINETGQATGSHMTRSNDVRNLWHDVTTKLLDADKAEFVFKSLWDDTAAEEEEKGGEKTETERTGTNTRTESGGKRFQVTIATDLRHTTDLHKTRNRNNEQFSLSLRGLPWRDELNILVPVLCGMFGAMILVLSAYFLRNCPATIRQLAFEKRSSGMRRRKSDLNLLMDNSSGDERP